MTAMLWVLEVYDEGDWGRKVVEKLPFTSRMRYWYEEWQQDHPDYPRRIKAYVRHDYRPAEEDHWT